MPLSIPARSVRRAQPEAQAPSPTAIDAGPAHAGEIRIGISSCLLGRPVRYDGGHKHDSLLTEGFGRFMRFVELCPEMELGLGAPRETLRLQRDEGATHLVGNKSGRDLTAEMTAFAQRTMPAIAAHDLSGYILKKDSPSCGLQRVKVYGPDGLPERTGSGLFAQALRETFPLLPLEEEGRLRDPRLRENFIVRVFAYRRLRDFFTSRWTASHLIAMHSREKYLLLAHSQKAYRELGRMVATSKGQPASVIAETYQRVALQALEIVPTVRRHSNVLQHMAGFFSREIGDEQRAELAAVIEDYTAGLVPLIVPITLIRHYVRLRKIEWLAAQVYLDPHPKELALRNHV